MTDFWFDNQDKSIVIIIIIIIVVVMRLLLIKNWGAEAYFRSSYICNVYFKHTFCGVCVPVG